MDEATALCVQVKCPVLDRWYELPWKDFCDGFAWTGDPETHKITAIDLFTCKRCGQQHTLTIPDNM